MKKSILIILSVIVSIGFSIVSFAGEWKQDTNGWWYQNDDGSYPVSRWNQIADKYYYFNDKGYLLTDTITPDGYTVNSDGIRIEKDNNSNNIILHNKDELNQYLYDNYRIIHTNFGDIEVGFKNEYGYSGNYASENSNNNNAYDYMINTMWSAHLQNAYYEVVDNINNSSQDIEIFEQCFKDYQYNMAQDIISKMPGKKIRGGFYSEGYKYQYSKVGYWNKVKYGWCNYEKIGSGFKYDSYMIESFTWKSFISNWD